MGQARLDSGTKATNRCDTWGRHRAGGRRGRVARAGSGGRVRSRFPVRDGRLPLGLGLLPEDRLDDGPRRPRRARRFRCDLLRGGRVGRGPRSHHALGPAARDRPGLRPGDQPAPGKAPSRDPGPAPRPRRGRCRPGGRSREHRGRVLGHRGFLAPRPAFRSRPADGRLHARGGRAYRPLRLRAGARAPGPARDERDEVKREPARERALGSRGRGGR